MASDDSMMPQGEPGKGGTVGARIGSLTIIVLVFSLVSMVVLAILLGALFVAIGVVALVVPAALIAGFSKFWRGPGSPGSSRAIHRGNGAGSPDDPPSPQGF
jgi:hypothetical protein